MPKDAGWKTSMVPRVSMMFERMPGEMVGRGRRFMNGQSGLATRSRRAEAGMSLLGGLLEPAHGLGMVVLHTLTVCIPKTEIVLSVGMSSLSGLPIPAHGLGMVSLHTLTVRTHDTEVVMSVGMSLLCRAPPQPKYLVHLPLLRLGQSAPRRLPTIHPPLHVKVPPRCLLKCLLGARG